jgi:hypothetical protein
MSSFRERAARLFGGKPQAYAVTYNLRREAAERGEAVVANIRKIRDGNPADPLFAWAQVEGRLVYVDRRSPFGNPFKVGRNGTRADVIAKFAEHWRQSPALQAEARRWREAYCSTTGR